MFLKRIDSNGDRWLWWPIRLRWVQPISKSLRSKWFTTHGWQVGTERCAESQTGRRCMPGFRDVFGRTLHLGRLKVLFGRERSKAERQVTVQAPPTTRAA